MAVTNQMLLEELQRVQARVNELAAGIALLCERAAGLEAWRNGHDENVHPRLRERIKALTNTQTQQGDRLWKVALQVAEIAALLATTTKLAGVW